MVREHCHGDGRICIDCMRDIWLVGMVGNFFCARGCLIRSAMGIVPSLSDQFLHPVNSVHATTVGNIRCCRHYVRPSVLTRNFHGFEMRE